MSDDTEFSGSQVWVVWWKYHDGSASGLGKAFADEDDAQELFTALKAHATSKQWFCEAVNYEVRALNGMGAR